MDDERVPISGYTTVKVFTSAGRDRAEMGDRLTMWVAREGLEIVAVEVLQSSDRTRHCISLVAFVRPLP